LTTLLQARPEREEGEVREVKPPHLVAERDLVLLLLSLSALGTHTRNQWLDISLPLADTLDRSLQIGGKEPSVPLPNRTSHGLEVVARL
jgi:hypothetical protein